MTFSFGLLFSSHTVKQTYKYKKNLKNYFFKKENYLKIKKEQLFKSLGKPSKTC